MGRGRLAMGARGHYIEGTGTHGENDVPRQTFFNMHTREGAQRRSIEGADVAVFRGDRVLVTMTTGAAGPEGRLHAHVQEQWTLVARGGCKLELEGRTVELGALDVAEIPSGARHRFVPSSADALLLNVFELAGDGDALPGEAEDAGAGASGPNGGAGAANARVFNMRAPKGGLPRKLAEGMNTTIFASARLMVSAVRIDPNCKGTLHKHPHEQWGVLMTGAGKRIAEKGFTPVTAGDVWFTPGEELHTFEAGAEGAFILEVFSPPREDYLKPA